MRDGICPKCSSNAIYEQLVPDSNLGLATFSHVNLTRYICRDCGYLEQYLLDEQNLDKLESSKHWRLLQKRKNDES